jgi:hypothetical protein
MKNETLKKLRFELRTNPLFKTSRNILAGLLKQYECHEVRRHRYKKLVKGTFTVLNDDYLTSLPSEKFIFKVQGCTYTLNADYAAVIAFENRLKKLRKDRF